MLIITNAAELARALDSPIAPNIKRLLTIRGDLIDLATFVVVAAGESMAAIEAAAGIPIATNIVDGSRYDEPDFVPSFEWALDHDGVYEVPFILNDDGFSVVLIVPACNAVDPVLLAMIRAHAEKATSFAANQEQADQPNRP